jgi:beta-glucosidase
MDDPSFDPSRRTVLAEAAGLALLAAAGPALAEGAVASAGPFPKGFRWGVATAGHQIEGNNTNSDLWLLENITPTVYADRSGDACDSYHRYEEDIALLAKLGFNSYRFSLEWARIEPTRGFFSNAELDHYHRVIDCCRKLGVDPAVTFLHTATPRWFAEAGGWMNADAPSLFARFCSTAAKALAGDMAFAFTINEPQVAKTFRSIGAMSNAYYAKHDMAALAMLAAAAKATGSQQFITTDYPDIDAMTPQLIAGHEQGMAAIKAERPGLPVGVTLNIIDFQPATDDNPHLPVRERAYGAWLDTVKRAGDFVGVQIYRQIRLPGKGNPLPAPPPLPFVNPSDLAGNLARPEAISNAVEYVYAETGKPILVTENGLQTDDDARRIWYIDAALANLRASIAKGVPVKGYWHWSLIDNFEWAQGYGPKFGLVAVDRMTFVRTPKPSAAHLGAIARRGAI